ncbi:MAG: ABC transporter ATP-binding protein [Sulfolobales archaeon]
MPIISIRRLSVTYSNNVKALDNIDLDVEEGEVVSIIGPSGCGKTTLANMILGIIPPEASVTGSIIVSGVDVIRDRKNLIDKIYRGIGIGYVTQVDTLLPWRTLIDNVILPLQIRKVNSSKAVARAKELIKLVGLEGFENMYPHQLSGGMRQRAQLARALITDPKILVMDEPFGALDALTRVILQEHLTNIIAKTRKTCIFITHDLEEAITVGTKVVVMSRRPGRIKMIKEIPFPYPREPFKLRTSREFEELKYSLWNSLASEVASVE